MSLAIDLENKVREYLDGDYEVTDVDTIPSVENVTFGKKAKRMKLCAYCIDMRKSSDLLTLHEKQTCGKIHKAFLTVASQVVLDNGGEIRSFNGDGLLAFWPAYKKSQINQAVRAALITKYLLYEKLSYLFENYSKIDFGIGIDWGDVYIVRAGISKNDNNNDLVFIGSCVNFATAISNQAKSPYHVEISTSTFDNLEENLLSYTSQGVKYNAWSNGSISWKDSLYNTKKTGCIVKIV